MSCLSPVTLAAFVLKDNNLPVSSLLHDLPYDLSAGQQRVPDLDAVIIGRHQDLADSDFITHLAYLTEAFVGDFRSVETNWSKRQGSSRLRWDDFRALIDAERGTASIGFSARSQPDVFWFRVHGTKLRVSASLFEPLLTIEKLHGGPRPLLPVRNSFSVASAYARSAVGGLWRKLAGRPVTYEGLWELLRRLYGAVGAGTDPPISAQQIAAVNRLVRALLDRERSE